MDAMHGAQECGDDAAAYVLGALEPGEVAPFRRHLETCVACRDEVQSLQHVADALPMAAPQYSIPRGLRRRVLAEVRSDSRTARTGWLPRPALSPRFAAALAAVAALVVVGAVELAGSGGPSTRIVTATVGAAQVRITGGHAELLVRRLPAPSSGHIYEVWIQRGTHAPSPTNALFSVTRAGAGDVDVPGDLRGVTTVMVTQERAGGTQHPTSAPVIVAHL